MKKGIRPSWKQTCVRIFLQALSAFFICPFTVASAEWIVEVDTLGLDRLESPVYCENKFPPDCQVTEILEDGNELLCRYQQDENGIYWILSGETKAFETRRFKISDSEKVDLEGIGIQVLEGPEQVSFRQGHDHVLSYQTAFMPAPPGVSPLLGKSGFVHPLKTPKGFVVTSIQPKDHIHHYGLWHPWTHTHVDGRPVDFWNIGLGQGTCRFDEILEMVSGPVMGRLKVRQVYEMILDAEKLKENLANGKWPDSLSTQISRPVLDEVLELQVWHRPGDENGFMLDYSITQTCRPGIEFRVDAYRYSGFGLRATQLWGNHNSGYLTDLGKDRFNANATRARWAQIFGHASGSDAGILMLSSIQNRDHPEFIRIWDQNANGGRANCFINFNPVQNQDGLLVPEKSYKRMYRIYVHDLKPNEINAEGLWRDFQNPLQCRLMKTSTKEAKP